MTALDPIGSRRHARRLGRFTSLGRKRSDRGATVISVLCCCLLALFGCVLVLGLGARAVERARVDAVADLVSLGAAHDPTSIAQAVADANHVHIERVIVAGQSTIIEVRSGTMRGRASAHLTMGAVGCSPSLLHCRGGTRR